MHIIVNTLKIFINIENNPAGMNLALSKRNDFCKLRIEEPAAPLKLRWESP